MTSPFEFTLLGGDICGSRWFSTDQAQIYRRLILEYVDVDKKARSKTECINEIELQPGLVVCDKWRTYVQYVQLRYFVEVKTKEPYPIEGVAEDCLHSPSVASALSAYVIALAVTREKDSSAKDVFIKLFSDCLISRP